MTVELSKEITPTQPFKKTFSDFLKGDNSTVRKIAVWAAFFFSCAFTIACGALTTACLVGTVAAGASGIGAPAIVPGAIVTCLGAGLTIGGAMLSAHIFREWL